MKKLSKEQTGIMALNVVSDDKFLEINGVKIKRKEYKGVPVLTVWDISEVHNRKAKTIGQSFSRNRKNLIENEDYYIVDKAQLSELKIEIKTIIPNNVKTVILFTSSGYLKLVKTFVNNTEYKVIKKVYEFLGGNENIDIYVSNERLEISFFKLLKEALKEIDVKLIHQHYVSGYRIDFFLPEYNFAIEYDEEHHKLRTKEDKVREREISKEIGCKFIRCSYKDSNIKNLMKVLKETVLKQKWLFRRQGLFIWTAKIFSHNPSFLFKWKIISFFNKTNYYRTYNHPYPAFKALSSEKVPNAKQQNNNFKIVDWYL